MTIDEAIKNLEFHNRHGTLTHHEDDVKAMELGIEALQKVKEQRNPDGWMGTLHLEGETEEVK